MAGQGGIGMDAAIRRRVLLAGGAGLGALGRGGAGRAQSAPLRIGVLNDQSGPYSAYTGPGSVVAARMAAEDFGGTVLGRGIEVLSADHQNKPDAGATIAREWIDRSDVRLILDIGHSGVALAVQQIIRDKDRFAIYTAVGTTQITGEACAPTGFSWCYDAYALMNGLTRAVTATGGTSWFLIVADYVFGYSLETEARAAIARNGGTVVGAVRHPEHVGDFGSFLLTAQGSGAKVVAMLNSGEDLTTALKQANEFGLSAGGQTVVAPLVFITDVRAMGLPTAKGLTFLTAFYWDRDEATRQFARRFFARHGAMPSMPQAAVYSGVSHYLKSVAAAGTVETGAVRAKMLALPVEDFYAGHGSIRPDGRMLHDMLLVRVKTPEQSKRDWDFYEILGTVPGSVAFSTLAESRCAAAKA